MKTTIKLREQMFDWVAVSRVGEKVVITAGPAPTSAGHVVITLDTEQTGVMVFSAEQEAKAIEKQRQHAGAFPHVDCPCPVRPCSHQAEMQRLAAAGLRVAVLQPAGQE